MASKNMYPLRSGAPKDIEVNFRFAPNFTSTVATSSIKPLRNISSITRSAAGTWIINLDDKYYCLTGCQATRVGANAAGVFRVAYSSDTISGYTGGNTSIGLVHEISGTATDIAAASTNLVLVKLTFADSTVGM